MAAPNMHATALVLGDRGVLIVGPSGSGKSTLALTLVAQFHTAGRLARIVADDQILLSAHGGRLICKAPPAIRGLVEVYGLGPQPIEVEAAALIDLVVRLLPAERMQRFAEETFEVVAGCRLPCMAVSERNASGALAVIAARLSLPPFG